MPVCVVTRQGVFSSTTSSAPPSSSRSTVMAPFLTNETAVVVCGMPSRRREHRPVAARLPSSDMKPANTRSGLSAFATAARIFAVPSESEPSAAVSFTWTARSAPMPSAVRSDWVTRSGPIETTTTSLLASLSFS